jgi:hypothetical protein
VEDSGHGGAKETQSTRERTMLEYAWQQMAAYGSGATTSEGDQLGALSIDVDALMRDDKIRY